MKILYLIRGVPGAGKTTLAHKMKIQSCEADDFFINESGEYVYNHAMIGKAHEYCQKMCEHMMLSGLPEIGVTNTFVTRREMEPYYKLAHRYQYTIVEIICRGGFENTHGVPQEKVRKMRKWFEY